MYKNKSVLVVVPARGGSKGIPLKNIKLLNAKPLIAYTGELISKLDFVDKAIVSTDSEKIGLIAEEYDLDFNFKRPLNLSGDFVGDFEVLEHALTQAEKIDEMENEILHRAVSTQTTHDY